MKSDNFVVHGLWIGQHLTALELLTIHSFLQQGHAFHLWAYDDIQTPLPAGTHLQDANEILDRQHIFSYKNTTTTGQGKGSLAGFSDVFRYKLLYEKGGWWADMDITCLRPLDFEAPYVFRDHDFLPVVGNMMKCPAGSPLMLDCFEQATRQVDANNTEWLKPILILNEQIEKHGLTQYIRPNISNPDRWEVVDYLRHFSPTLPDHYHFIHWMNEGWRSLGIDKNSCIAGSLLAQKMKEHEIAVNTVELERPLQKRLVLKLKVWLYPLVPYSWRRPLKALYQKLIK